LKHQVTLIATLYYIIRITKQKTEITIWPLNEQYFNLIKGLNWALDKIKTYNYTLIYCAKGNFWYRIYLEIKWFSNWFKILNFVTAQNMVKDNAYCHCYPRA